jgi:sec-independent protein translocase protein TatB
MFGISFIELLVIFVVALLVLGPEKLPGAVRTGALWLGRAKRTFNNVKSEIEQQLNTDDIRRQLHNESILADIEKARKSADKLVQDTKKELDKTQDGINRAISSANVPPPTVVSSSAVEGVPTGADDWPDTTAERTATAVSSQPETKTYTGFVGETAMDGPAEEPAAAASPATEAEPKKSAEPSKAPVQDFYNSPPSGRVTVTGKTLSAPDAAPPEVSSGKKD